MSLTISTSNASPSHVPLGGGMYLTLAKVTFDDSYPDGGESLAAADIPGSGNVSAMTRILAVLPCGPAVSADGETAVDVAFDATAGKLQAFWSPAATGDAQAAGALAEVTSSTDLSLLSVTLVVLGMAV